MSSRITDETFLSTHRSLDFYVIFDKTLSKSEKFERLFQHQMPTLDAWALVASLMIWLPGALALFPILYQMSDNIWNTCWGFLGVSLSIVVGGFMLPLVLGFMVYVLPIIAIRAYLANRGLVFYWVASFAMQVFLCGLYLYVVSANKFWEIGTLWSLGLGLSPRIFGFVLIMILYFLYRPNHSSTISDNESSLDEHLIR
jgi:hypothetical protein